MMNSSSEHDRAQSRRIAIQYQKDKKAAQRQARKDGSSSVWAILEDAGWTREQFLVQEDDGRDMTARQLKEFQEWVNESDVSCTNDELGLDEHGNRDDD
jgi:hypothetical protein